MRITFIRGGMALAAVALASSVLEAQSPRALERRADRNARQAVRQANRADYYGAQTWSTLDPWLQRSGIRPAERAANAAAATAATANAVGDAVGDVARATTNAADRTVAGAAAYGFRDNARANDQFFYDYYTYTPTYYYGQRNAERYAGAIRYFDSDNDGVYDYQSNFRDSDNDGVYDEFDRIDFYGGAQAQARTEEVDAIPNMQGPSDSRRYQVQGEIEATKSAEVNGNEHLLVGLKHEGDTLAVDLGPVEAIRDQQVSVGQTISASGPVESIGDKRILFADYAVIGGREIQIDRSVGSSLSGSIVDVTTTRVGTTEHYLAVIEAQDQRQLVDLGPVATYKAELRPQTQVVVQGVPIMANQHRVIMADQVRLNGQTIRIDRAASLNF